MDRGVPASALSADALAEVFSWALALELVARRDVEQFQPAMQNRTRNTS